MIVIGCDISAYFSNYVVFKNSQEIDRFKIRHCSEGFKKLREFLESIEEDKVIVLEQTGIYSLPVIQIAWETGTRIILVEGKDLYQYRKLLANGNKNDWIDAELLARYYLSGLKHYELNIEPKALYELKTLVRFRERLIKEINRRKNYIKQLITVLYPDMNKNGKTKFYRKVKEYELEGEEGFKSERLKRILVYETEMLKIAEEELEKVEEEIMRIIEENKRFREQAEIMKQLGLGNITIAVLLATFWDINRFPNLKKFRAYMGYGFKNFQSGKKSYEKFEHTTRLAKRVLFMYVLQSIRGRSRNERIKELYKKFRARGDGGKKAIFKTSVRIINWIYMALKQGGAKHGGNKEGEDNKKEVDRKNSE